jgi:hypothetical protein
VYRRLGRSVLVSVCGLAIAVIILFISYAIGFRLGRNMDNLWHLLKLTVPLVLLLGCVAAVWPEPNAKRKRFSSSLVLMTVGVALGCVYWYLVQRTVGLGFLSLAIQALACWVAVAVAGLLLALNRWSFEMLASATVVCALAIALPAPAFNFLAHNQILTVAIVVPEDLASVTMQQEEVGFDSQSEAGRSASQVLETIHAAGLQGNYRILHLSRQGEGKQGLAIVILNAPINGRTLLAEPDRSEVIYIQRPEGWTKVPTRAPTLHRNIEIWGASDDRDSLAYFGIPDATGISLMGRVPARAGESQ